MEAPVQGEHVSLKEYVEALLKWEHDYLSLAIKNVETTAAAALASSEKAIMKAETAADKRFDSVNEFRATLTDQASRFVTRDGMWGYLVGAVGIIAAIVTLTVYFVKK